MRRKVVCLSRILYCRDSMHEQHSYSGCASKEVAIITVTSNLNAHLIHEM